jgi:quercetin dioxygenase-like cupin family protein
MSLDQQMKLDTGYSLSQHREGESRHLDAPLHRIDLAAELGQLRRGALFQHRGQEAKTLIKLPNLQVVLVALRTGARVASHRMAGASLVHVLAGRARVTLEGTVVDLPSGHFLALAEAIASDLEAQEESAVILTLCAHPRDAGPRP